MQKRIETLVGSALHISARPPLCLRTKVGKLLHHAGIALQRCPIVAFCLGRSPLCHERLQPLDADTGGLWLLLCCGRGSRPGRRVAACVQQNGWEAGRPRFGRKRRRSFCLLGMQKAFWTASTVRSNPPPSCLRAQARRASSSGAWSGTDAWADGGGSATAAAAASVARAALAMLRLLACNCGCDVEEAGGVGRAACGR